MRFNIKHLILSLAILLIVVRLIYIFVPFDRDEGAYAYIGWLWFTGRGLPYVSAFDPKLPLTYILFAIGNFVTPNSFVGTRILAFLYEFSILGVFYLLARKVTATKLLSLFVTLLVGYFYVTVRLEGSGFNTEIEMVLPLLMFVYLVWTESKKKNTKQTILFFAGLIGGLALLFKGVGIIPVGAICLWFIAFKKDIRGIFLLLIGIIVPPLILFIYFYTHNALPAFIQDVYSYNQDYTRAGLALSDIYIRAGSTGIVGVIKWFFLIPDVLLPFTIFSIFCLILSFQKKSSHFWLSIILISSLWIIIKLGGREFPHYYLYLPFALGFSCLPGIERLYNEFDKKFVIGVIMFFIGIIIIPDLFTIIQGPYAVSFQEFGGQADWFFDAITVGKLIHTEYPSQSLLVWANEPEVYYYAAKLSTSRYANLYGFYYFTEDGKKWLANLEKNPPDIIVSYENDPSTQDVEKFLLKHPIYKKKNYKSSYSIYIKTK